MSTGMKVVLAIFCILAIIVCVGYIIEQKRMDELKYKAEVARMNSESAREATERLEERIKIEKSAMQTVEYLSNK
jgi:Na+-transporting methylmalonyl-CoA/oxaloacetate decarboxylase gamma subunit